MSQVKVQGNASGTGVLTVTSPNTNSNYTLTLPANTGTILTDASTFGGTGPAFSATKITTNQSVSTGVNTKVTFNNVDFDTNSNFASSTFTPTVAGYYVVTGTTTIAISDSTGTQFSCYIFKNGAAYARTIVNYSGNNGGAQALTTTAVIYMNGSTDYLEVYAYGNTSTGTVSFTAGNTGQCRFTAALVRSA